MSRAQITVQMTIVFAMIAGILVFGMVFRFLTSETEQATTEQNIDALNYVENELKALAATPNNFNVLEVDNTIQFFCDDKENSVMILEGADTSRSTRYQAIFTFPEQNGKFFAWTREWEIPGASDRLLLLANSNLQVVVPEVSGERDNNFRNRLPDQLPVGTEARNGFDHYRFVFFNRAQFNSFSLSTTNVPISAIVVNETAAEFYVVDEGWTSIGSVEFNDENLVYAAAYSSTPTMFECNLDKALFKFELQSKINERRIGTILSGMTASDECFGPLTEVQGWHEFMRIGLIDSPSNVALTDSPEEMDVVRATAGNISRIQNELQRGRNCPTI